MKLNNALCCNTVYIHRTGHILQLECAEPNLKLSTACHHCCHSGLQTQGTSLLCHLEVAEGQLEVVQ